MPLRRGRASDQQLVRLVSLFANTIAVKKCPRQALHDVQGVGTTIALTLGRQRCEPYLLASCDHIQAPHITVAWARHRRAINKRNRGSKMPVLPVACNLRSIVALMRNGSMDQSA